MTGTRPLATGHVADLLGSEEQVLVLRYSTGSLRQSDLMALTFELAPWRGIVERTRRLLRVRCDLVLKSGAEGEDALEQVIDVVAQWAERADFRLRLEGFSLQSRSEYEASILMPEVPPLVGINELAKRLKVSRQRASVLAKEGRFGEPLAQLDATPVWSADAIDAVLAGTHGATKWERKVGRPRAAASKAASS